MFFPDFFAPDQYFSPIFLAPTKKIWDKFPKFLCPFPTQIYALNWKLKGYIWTSGVNPFNLRGLVGEKWLIFKISREKATKIALGDWNFPRLNFSRLFFPTFFPTFFPRLGMFISETINSLSLIKWSFMDYITLLRSQ